MWDVYTKNQAKLECNVKKQRAFKTACNDKNMSKSEYGCYVVNQTYVETIKGHRKGKSSSKKEPLEIKKAL